MGNPVVIGVLGDAAESIAAHLGSRPVGVVHLHAAVGLPGLRGQDQDQAISADSEMTVRHTSSQVTGGFHDLVEVIVNQVAFDGDVEEALAGIPRPPRRDRLAPRCAAR